MLSDRLLEWINTHVTRGEVIFYVGFPVFILFVGYLMVQLFKDFPKK